MTVELHALTDGPANGPVVLLGGSLGSTLDMWQPQVEPLVAAGYRVVRYDHRGHGGSPVPDGPYALGDLGGDVLALLDRLEVEKAAVVGLSLGGMVAMWLGIHAPDRVDRLVLCCTSAKLGPPEMWADRAATVRARGTGAIADGVTGRWFTPAFPVEEKARYRQMVENTPDLGYAACCAAIAEMDLIGELGQIKAPTQVIAGADDAATPPEHGQAIADGIPGARFEVVAGAAHLGSVERPVEFTSLILNRLEH